MPPHSPNRALLGQDNKHHDFNSASQIKSLRQPPRLGKPEEFAALCAHIAENGFYNAGTPRLDAGYRIPL
jgi:hypothetical protein